MRIHNADVEEPMSVEQADILATELASFDAEELRVVIISYLAMGEELLLWIMSRFLSRFTTR